MLMIKGPKVLSMRRSRGTSSQNFFSQLSSNTYDLSDSAIFVTGRTTAYVNNGAKHRMLTRNSCIEFDTNSTTVSILVAAGDPPNAYRVYLNNVDQGNASPAGTAGEGNTQTLTISGMAGNGTWTNVRVVINSGNEGFSGFLDTGTVSVVAGSIRFKGGQSPVNMVRELVGGATGQTKGLFNAPPQSAALGDISTGASSPYCVGNNWQVIAERRGRCNKIGVVMASGGGAVGLYKDGVFQEDVVLTGDGTTQWRLVIFTTSFNVSNHGTYSVSVKSGPGYNPAYIDEIVLFGNGSTTPAFDTLAVTRNRVVVMWGDSIEEANIAGTHQSGVWGLLLAQEFDSVFYNRGKSGDTIAGINTRFVADNADIAASTVTECYLGVGENDLATPQATFTNAVRDFINNSFTRYTNLVKLFVRGIQPPDGTYNGYLQDGIAASDHASACIYVATPAGVDTVDGQHPTTAGYVTMRGAFASTLHTALAWVDPVAVSAVYDITPAQVIVTCNAMSSLPVSTQASAADGWSCKVDGISVAVVDAIIAYPLRNQITLVLESDPVHTSTVKVWYSQAGGTVYDSGNRELANMLEANALTLPGGSGKGQFGGVIGSGVF